MISKFPHVIHLQNGTKVEVNPSATGKTYIFELFKPDGGRDTFTWTPANEATKDDMQGTDDGSPMKPEWSEALHIFWRDQG